MRPYPSGMASSFRRRPARALASGAVSSCGRDQYSYHSRQVDINDLPDKFEQPKSLFQVVLYISAFRRVVLPDLFFFQSLEIVHIRSSLNVWFFKQIFLYHLGFSLCPFDLHFDRTFGFVQNLRDVLNRHAILVLHQQHGTVSGRDAIQNGF